MPPSKGASRATGSNTVGKQRKADSAVTKKVQQRAAAAAATTETTTDNNTDGAVATASSPSSSKSPEPRNNNNSILAMPASNGKRNNTELVPQDLADGTRQKGPRPDTPFACPVHFQKLMQKVYPDDPTFAKVGPTLHIPFYRPVADSKFQPNSYEKNKWYAVRARACFKHDKAMYYNERGYIRNALAHVQHIVMLVLSNGHPVLLIRGFTGTPIRSPDGVEDGTLRQDLMVFQRMKTFSAAHYYDQAAGQVLRRHASVKVTTAGDDDDDGAADVEPRETYRVEGDKIAAEESALFLDSVRREHHLEVEKNEMKAMHTPEPRPNGRFSRVLGRFVSALGASSQGDSDSATDDATVDASDSDDDDRRTLDSAPMAAEDAHDVFDLRPKKCYIEGNAAYTVNLTPTEAQLLRDRFGLAAHRLNSVTTYDDEHADRYASIRWVGAVTSNSNGKKITDPQRVRDFVTKLAKHTQLSSAEVSYIGYGNLRLKFDAKITSATVAAVHELMRDGTSGVSHLKVLPDIDVPKPQWANVPVNVPQKQRTKFEPQPPEIGKRRRVCVDTPLQLRDVKLLAEQWDAKVVNQQSSSYGDISSYIFEWQQGVDVEQYEVEEGIVVQFGRREDHIVVVHVLPARQSQRQ